MRILLIFVYFFIFSNLHAHENDELIFLNCKGVFPYEIAMGSYEGATEEQILKIDLKKKIMLFSTGYEYKIDTEALNTKHLFEVIYGERDTRSGSAYGYGSGIFIETIVIDRFKGRTFFTYRNKKTKKFHISQTFKISCLKIERGF